MTIIIVVSDRIVLGRFLTFSTCTTSVSFPKFPIIVWYALCTIYCITAVYRQSTYMVPPVGILKCFFLLSIRNDSVFEKRFMRLLLYYVPTDRHSTFMSMCISIIL